jgi:hypothetical protein
MDEALRRSGFGDRRRRRPQPSMAAGRSLMAPFGPAHSLLQDPEALFEFMPDVNFANPAQMCGSLGLTGAIATRAPAIAKVCGRLASLPTFDSVNTSFDAVHEIDSLIKDVPDAVIVVVGDILTSVNSGKLPAPRPSGSTVCNIFPRLCR